MDPDEIDAAICSVVLATPFIAILSVLLVFDVLIGWGKKESETDDA